jgi:ABC-2 type transport system ATP-binding protein
VPYRQLSNPAWHVGILLDASAQHSGRTGREVMELSAQVLGVDRARVPELLDRVGLPPTAANKRIGNYSLGMRQRLGIAHALLGEPEVLILDPEGIHWMRYLLRAFAERGGTVLLSSHLLREIDVVADRLVVIGNGRIVAQGTRDELVTGTGVRVRALVPAELKQALARFNVSATPTADGAFIAQTDVATVGRAAAEAGVVLLELRPAEDGLENLFLSLTGTANRRDDA